MSAATRVLETQPVEAGPREPAPGETGRVEPDLIDRIAGALPEDVRAEYYRELRHCRALPDSDEMLRLLRAMQFLVLLIEQAPARVAEERERLDKLLAAAVDKVGKISAASETYHTSLQRRLAALPADIADGISPDAVARKIHENLRREFVRSMIPKTASDLDAVAERLKHVCSEFSTSSDHLGHVYRGAAEDARKAVASLKLEISQATEAAAGFTNQVARKFSRAWAWMLFMLTGGVLMIGLALGMMIEHMLLPPPAPALVPAAPVVQSTPEPAHKTPAAKGQK